MLELSFFSLQINFELTEFSLIELGLFMLQILLDHKLLTFGHDILTLPLHLPDPLIPISHMHSLLLNNPVQLVLLTSPVLPLVIKPHQFLL